MALVAAVARNGVIGRNGRLPWRLPEEMKRFRMLTIGHAVIMGRKTWESIGRPLSQRQNIVVTRQAGLRAPGALAVASLDAAIAAVVLPQPAFVIGGEALYRAALHIADVLYLTEIDADFEGDARFPDFDRTAWATVSRERRCEGCLDYDFVTYLRS